MENKETEIRKIEKRIKEIKKELDYCRRRDEVCCCIGGDEEIYELTYELNMLEDKLEEM